MLQTIIVFGEHTRSQCHLEHVPGERDLVAHLHTTSTLEDLYIYACTDHLDHLAHQLHPAYGDVAYFILRYGTIDLYRDEVRDDSFYHTVCHCIYYFFCLRLNSSSEVVLSCLS